ncbi:glycosyltransferase [Rhodococcus erythropolis]|uniref:glycosyltransferase n=1 Tax=Rhodococcus erythropolis TaxID=1833 RepID=UPI003857872B
MAVEAGFGPEEACVEVSGGAFQADACDCRVSVRETRNSVTDGVNDQLVTVVIPSLGRSELVRTIESVRNQTHRDIEIIVVLDTAMDEGGTATGADIVLTTGAVEVQQWEETWESQRLPDASSRFSTTTTGGKQPRSRSRSPV